jgi:hypothetical protein
MPGLGNTSLKANIAIHIFYKSPVYSAKQKQLYKVRVLTNKIICLWSDLNTEPLNLNDNE